jgi:hypothetical protein
MDKLVQQVKTINYLGVIMTENGTWIVEVKSIIGMATFAFDEARELAIRGLKTGLKKRMVKTLIWPVALYGWEPWTMEHEIVDKLKAF